MTGGAGFIGSNPGNRLREDNDVVAVNDTYSGDRDDLDRAVIFVEASVFEDDYPVDVVFHLAALSSQNIHENDPQRGCHVNVEGFVNTVERARKAGYNTVVYASTS